MILLLIIFSTTYGVNAMMSDFYIDAEYLEFVVSIWYFHEHRCTGSILDENHVLTSGSCVVHLTSTSLSVAAGITQSRPRDIQLVPVKEIHFHPEFQRICLAHDLYWENNIAILELSEALRWESTISAVPLIDVEYSWNPCHYCDMFGWHPANVDNFKLLTLRWSLGTVVEEEVCDDMDVTHWKNEKCLETEFNTVLEDGDYGAPVVCKGVAVGIIVHGGSLEGSPSVLLSVYPYLDFIASILLPRKINIPGKFPYYVALFHNGNYLCGGSIIDSTHIVTAAHCVDFCTRRTLVVLIGRSEFSVNDLFPEELSLVDSIQKHPDYQHHVINSMLSVLKNDIAVVRLRASLTWSANVKAIGLADYLPVGQYCQVHRWSRRTTKDGNIIARSLSSPVVLQGYAACRLINPFRQSTDSCVVNMYSLPIATSGDSGSPMVCNEVIVGLLSSHTLSARVPWGPFQGIYYTSIYPHLRFISDAVAARTS